MTEAKVHHAAFSAPGAYELLDSLARLIIGERLTRQPQEWCMVNDLYMPLLPRLPDELLLQWLDLVPHPLPRLFAIRIDLTLPSAASHTRSDRPVLVESWLLQVTTPSPPVTSPPVTSPPVTSPPVTSPPVTSPPVISTPVKPIHSADNRGEKHAYNPADPIQLGRCLLSQLRMLPLHRLLRALRRESTDTESNSMPTPRLSLGIGFPNIAHFAASPTHVTFAPITATGSHRLALSLLHAPHPLFDTPRAALAHTGSHIGSHIGSQLDPRITLHDPSALIVVVSSSWGCADDAETTTQHVVRDNVRPARSHKEAKPRSLSDSAVNMIRHDMSEPIAVPLASDPLLPAKPRPPQPKTSAHHGSRAVSGKASVHSPRHKQSIDDSSFGVLLMDSDSENDDNDDNDDNDSDDERALRPYGDDQGDKRFHSSEISGDDSDYEFDYDCDDGDDDPAFDQPFSRSDHVNFRLTNSSFKSNQYNSGAKGFAALVQRRQSTEDLSPPSSPPRRPLAMAVPCGSVSCFSPYLGRLSS
eukprot:TRINITY_DN643_c0_g2_i1.p1 TRINITY_DN643_c0_g2~~TRINITY_DN643_c0_g2_i1.p1  ORF type:complete len:528 (+),score=83.46 TRINITY_DN643_c0_g2_i1:666-2249(+)